MEELKLHKTWYAKDACVNNLFASANSCSSIAGPDTKLQKLEVPVLLYYISPLMEYI